MTVRAPFRRISWFLLLALIALTSGCVYLRLLQLKSQLADFDAHFETRTDNGLAIICKEPVLLAEDVRWLGADPETIRKTDHGEHWHVRWVKDLPPGNKEAVVHDVDLDFEFKDKQLTAVQVPEQYFAYFPKKLLMDLLRSTGKARVDKRSRQAQVDTGAVAAKDGVGTPDRASVESLLGDPTEKSLDNTSLRYRYRYRTTTPTGPGKAIEVIFIFDLKTNTLRHIVGKLPKGTLNFDFGPAVKV